MFFDGPFYKQIIPTSSLLLEKKRCPLIGTHTHLLTVKEGIKQAIMAAEFNMETLQCHGQIASSSDLRAKTYTTFRRNILRVKQRSRPEKLSGLSGNVPNNTKSIIRRTVYFSITDDY